MHLQAEEDVQEQSFGRVGRRRAEDMQFGRTIVVPRDDIGAADAVERIDNGKERARLLVEVGMMRGGQPVGDGRVNAGDELQSCPPTSYSTRNPWMRIVSSDCAWLPHNDEPH